MNTLRKAHLYLGCIFAPMIIYFSISGAWQIFRFNDIPKEEPPSALRTFAHELSKPHTHSTLPGKNHKTEHSDAFNWLALFMAVALVTTTALGLALAFRFGRSTRLVFACLVVGTGLPIILLLVR